MCWTCLSAPLFPEKCPTHIYEDMPTCHDWKLHLIIGYGDYEVKIEVPSKIGF